MISQVAPVIKLSPFKHTLDDEAAVLYLVDRFGIDVPEEATRERLDERAHVSVTAPRAVRSGAKCRDKTIRSGSRS